MPRSYYTGPDRKPGVLGATPQLNRYWTQGPGLARWATSPHPWTTLKNLLVYYFGNEEVAKRLATLYFKKVFGYGPGADIHRVNHGKPPRGKRIGPG